jgi:hypothetical protein
MRQKLRRAILPRTFSLCDSLTKLVCVPINDDGSKEVQTGYSVMLPFRGSISYFALPPDPQCVL